MQVLADLEVTSPTRTRFKVAETADKHPLCMLLQLGKLQQNLTKIISVGSMNAGLHFHTKVNLFRANLPY